jgi:hypothetical protein
LEEMRDNKFEANCSQDISLTPRLVDSDEDDWHMDENLCGV